MLSPTFLSARVIHQQKVDGREIELRKENGQFYALERVGNVFRPLVLKDLFGDLTEANLIEKLKGSVIRLQGPCLFIDLACPGGSSPYSLFPISNKTFRFVMSSEATIEGVHSYLQEYPAVRALSYCPEISQQTAIFLRGLPSTIKKVTLKGDCLEQAIIDLVSHLQNSPITMLTLNGQIFTETMAANLKTALTGSKVRSLKLEFQEVERVALGTLLEHGLLLAHLNITQLQELPSNWISQVFRDFVPEGNVCALYLPPMEQAKDPLLATFLKSSAISNRHNFNFKNLDKESQKVIKDTTKTNRKKREELYERIMSGQLIPGQDFTNVPLLDTDGVGNTALHLACRAGNLENIEQIIRVCPIQLLNRYGELPLDMADPWNMPQIAKMLNEPPLPIILPKSIAIYTPNYEQEKQQYDESVQSVLEKLLQTLNEDDLLDRPKTLDSGLEPTSDLQLTTQELEQLETLWSQIDHLQPSPDDISDSFYLQLTCKLERISEEHAFLKQQQESQKERSDVLESRLSLTEKVLERRVLLNERLEELIRLDGDNPHKPLQTFYQFSLDYLTCFAAAVLTLRSKMVSRRNSWKDGFINYLFDFFGFGSEVASTATSFFWGAGIIISLVVQPPLRITREVCEKYRDNKKGKEIKGAMRHFSGGFEAIDVRCQEIAIELTFLLQQQLPLLKPESFKKLLKGFISSYVHCILKNKVPDSKRNEANQFAKSVLRVSAMVDQKTLYTVSERKWNMRKMLQQAGIAYVTEEGQWRYLDLKHRDDKNIELTPVLNMNKYGYLAFRDEATALQYVDSLKKIWVEEHGGHIETVSGTDAANNRRRWALKTPSARRNEEIADKLVRNPHFLATWNPPLLEELQTKFELQQRRIEQLETRNTDLEQRLQALEQKLHAPTKHRKHRKAKSKSAVAKESS